MSTATRPAAIVSWIVTVHHDGRPLTQNLRASSSVAAITMLAEWLAVPVEAFTEAHAVRA